MSHENMDFKENSISKKNVPEKLVKDTIMQLDYILLQNLGLIMTGCISMFV